MRARESECRRGAPVTRSIAYTVDETATCSRCPRPQWPGTEQVKYRSWPGSHGRCTCPRTAYGAMVTAWLTSQASSAAADGRRTRSCTHPSHQKDTMPPAAQCRVVSYRSVISGRALHSPSTPSANSKRR
eukprot:scaffold9913_cov141-Isochrysis_galbana.AAC.5